MVISIKSLMECLHCKIQTSPDSPINVDPKSCSPKISNLLPSKHTTEKNQITKQNVTYPSKQRKTSL